MSQEHETSNSPRSMHGQSARLPGSSRSVALHDQLYRYAEDLQQMIERNGKLEAHYEALRETCDQLSESRDELDRLLHASRDIHVVTDPAGTIVQTNPAAEVLGARDAMAGSKLESWIQPAYMAAFLALQQGTAAGGALGELECELHLTGKSPGERTMIVIASVIGVRRDGELSGRVLGCVGDGALVAAAERGESGGSGGEVRLRGVRAAGEIGRAHV